MGLHSLWPDFGARKWPHFRGHFLACSVGWIIRSNGSDNLACTSQWLRICDSITWLYILVWSGQTHDLPSKMVEIQHRGDYSTGEKHGVEVGRTETNNITNKKNEQHTARGYSKRRRLRREPHACGKKTLPYSRRARGEVITNNGSTLINREQPMRDDLLQSHAMARFACRIPIIQLSCAQSNLDVVLRMLLRDHVASATNGAPLVHRHRKDIK